ncbi:hypothetical protein MPSEU_000486200 [Mayamaea pseudoterrestris]|nr:hypothetical protein MPSEU_000486200 [Mayamaea pseudoterrestris]
MTSISSILLLYLFIVAPQVLHAQNANCRLCTDGSDLPDSFMNTTLFFLGGTQSCRTADEYLGRQSDSAACENAWMVAFGDQVVDIESFCGCPGVSPPNLCSLCSQGGLVFEEKQDLEVVLYDGNVTFSCQEVEDMAEYINDQDVCDNGVKFAEVQCCDGQAAVPTPPTPPPTMAPSRTLSTNPPTVSSARPSICAAGLGMAAVAAASSLVLMNLLG